MKVLLVIDEETGKTEATEIPSVPAWNDVLDGLGEPTELSNFTDEGLWIVRELLKPID